MDDPFEGIGETDIVRLVARACALGWSEVQMYRYFGNCRYTVPVRPPDYKARIVEEYDGANALSLCQRYSVSRATLRDILRKSGAADPAA